MTFSTMTTLPSATEVTRRPFSESGAVRLGTLKNQVMNTMNTTRATAMGMLIQRLWMKYASMKISTAHMHQLVSMVP